MAKLSENEMARLMMDNIEVIIPGEFTLRKPIATTMWGFDKAAHAIAEKMAEGVVLETEGAWLPPSATHKGVLWIAGDEHSPAVVTGGLPTIMEGKERVTVTGTKEE